MTQQVQTKFNLDALHDEVIEKRKIYEEKMKIRERANNEASAASFALEKATEAFRKAVKETKVWIG